MKKYLIFDLDGTLIQSNNQIEKIIYKYIREKIDPELIDTAKYYIKNHQGAGLKDCLLAITHDKENAEKYADDIYREINKIESKITFFEGAQETIKKLSEKYTLFLSTGNSDEFANDMLKQGNIHTYFSKILGSSVITKSSQHIHDFIQHTGDRDFCKNAIYLGDGQKDREIAKEMQIDFIHIGNDGEDKYEIKSVKDIYKIINKI